MPCFFLLLLFFFFKAYAVGGGGDSRALAEASMSEDQQQAQGHDNARLQADKHQHAGEAESHQRAEDLDVVGAVLGEIVPGGENTTVSPTLAAIKPA